MQFNPEVSLHLRPLQIVLLPGPCISVGPKLIHCSNGLWNPDLSHPQEGCEETTVAFWLGFTCSKPSANSLQNQLLFFLCKFIKESKRISPPPPRPVTVAIYKNHQI